MFGWKRRAWAAEERLAWSRGECARHYSHKLALIDQRDRLRAKAAGRAATIRRLVEERAFSDRARKTGEAIWMAETERADKAEAELSDERANRRHWEQTAGELNEELARVRSERDAAIEALREMTARIGVALASEAGKE